jgi:hypothetical protein
MTLDRSTLEAFSPFIGTNVTFFPSGVAKKYVDANLVNTQALERADHNNQITSAFPRQPVRSVVAEKPRRPRTSSSGGTLLELEDLGLSWSRQATQNVLRCRRDARRTTKGLEKLEFERKVKVD